LEQLEVIPQSEIEAMDERIHKTVDEAVTWAESRPWPDPARLLEGVYDRA
jgi:TPP-dependent pyruvate/acetoin dehydrogenase alpha subunit